MCAPCAAKKILNEDSLAVIRDGEKIRKRLEKMVRKGELTEEQAGHILEPLMAADRANIAHGGLALALATERLADAGG